MNLKRICRTKTNDLFLVKMEDKFLVIVKKYGIKFSRYSVCNRKVKSFVSLDINHSDG